jgi:hypothetical protein
MKNGVTAFPGWTYGSEVQPGGMVDTMYCGPVLRHLAELMLPAVDLGGRVWLGGKPCKGGPAAPAFGG